jgi:hypothetical protein
MKIAWKQFQKKQKGIFFVDSCDEYGWAMTTLLGTCDSSAIVSTSLASAYILVFLFSSLLDTLFRHLLREQVIFPRDSTVRYIFTFRLQLSLFLTFCSINRNGRCWLQSARMCRVTDYCLADYVSEGLVASISGVEL